MINLGKIVRTSVVFIGELLIASLVLVCLLNFKTDDYKVAVVENNNLSKMCDAVNVMFTNNKSDDESLANDFDNNKQEEQVSTDDTKEEDLEEYKEAEKKVDEKVVESVQEEKTESSYIEEASTYNVIESYTGTLTGYGPDCYGCSGNTTAGYYVGNTIYYDDATFGTVRIVASDPSIPLYSIVRISNIPGVDPIIAIVLDRGGNVVFDRFTLFDLLFESESSAMNTAYNVNFEILRKGNA